jgi:hypothetical protein
MSTGDIFLEVEGLLPKAHSLATFVSLLSRNLGSIKILEG